MPSDVPSPIKVFVSSTFIDNRERRELVTEAILRLPALPVGMERFTASIHPTVDQCERWLAECSLYVGIVAHRYGWIPTQSEGGDGERSITEIEYDLAKQKQIPRLMFQIEKGLVDPDADFDEGSERWPKQGKLERFKQKYAVDQMPAVFHEKNLGTLVLQALHDWVEERAELVRDGSHSDEGAAARATASIVVAAGTAPEAADPRAELVRRFGPMLRELWAELCPVRLFAVARQTADAEEVSIFSLYTALEVPIWLSARDRSGSRISSEVEVGFGGGELELVVEQTARTASEADAHRGRKDQPGAPQAELARALTLQFRAEVGEQPEWQRSEHRRRVRALEVAAVAPRLVIIGGPGSGKSTFVQHLAACLAGALLDKDEARFERWCGRSSDVPAWMPWEQEPFLPLFVELRRFAASSAFPTATEEGRADHLFDYLGLGSESRAEQARTLREHALSREGEGLLLILDGLDETPAVEGKQGEFDVPSTRERIKQTIRAWVRLFPKSRVLLTSRPYAYEPGSPWRLDTQGFEEVDLAAFSEDQVAAFCRHWYRGMAERRVLPPEEVAVRAERLAADLRSEPHLGPLAERPLLLTMLADVDTQQGRLPRNRASLYEKSAELFLNRWNAARESGRPGANKLTVELGMHLDQLQRAVDELAYEAHRTVEGKDAAVISAGKVVDVLRRHGWKGESERVIDFLHERSGILVAESRDHYRFPHRIFQEYLAACHRTFVKGFPDAFVAEVRADPERWREVVPLAIGKIAETPFMVLALVKAMLRASAADSEDRVRLLAYFCARGVTEADLCDALRDQEPEQFERLRELLLDWANRGGGAERDRVSAAEVLGQMGDPRVESLERVPIRGGEFWMGADARDERSPRYDREAFSSDGPPHRVEVDDFQIARYPVTVSQFQEFLLDPIHGYLNPRNWDPRGWSWRENEGIEAPASWEQQLRYPNRPVVGVSWYEAAAFARWAEGRLPSEAEWEYVASGRGAWRFPWGDAAPSADHAAFDLRIDHPVPVGIYPGAQANPWGLRDLAGNVWEWCQDVWHDSYEADPPCDGSAWLKGGNPSACVLRGGAFYFAPHYLRASSRFCFVRELRLAYVGFRVAWRAAGGPGA